jgi:hypothetical protein
MRCSLPVRGSSGWLGRGRAWIVGVSFPCRSISGSSTFTTCQSPSGAGRAIHAAAFLTKSPRAFAEIQPDFGGM